MPLIDEKDRKSTHSVYSPSKKLFDSIQNTVTENLCFGYLTAAIEHGKTVDHGLSDFIAQFNVTCRTKSELRNKYYAMLKMKISNELVL
jgi:hypothetical protein